MFGFKVICWALLFIFKLFVLFYHIAILSVTETVNSIRDKRIQFCVTGGAAVVRINFQYISSRCPQCIAPYIKH